MRVAGTHKSIRQPCAVLFRMLQPTLPFHLGIELLQIVLRELIKRYMPDSRDNMIVDNVLVAVFRRFAKSRLTYNGYGDSGEVDPASASASAPLRGSTRESRCDFRSLRMTQKNIALRSG